MTSPGAAGPDQALERSVPEGVSEVDPEHARRARIRAGPSEIIARRTCQVVIVDIGWHVGSRTKHSAVVPDSEPDAAPKRLMER